MYNSNMRKCPRCKAHNPSKKLSEYEFVARVLGAIIGVLLLFGGCTLTLTFDDATQTANDSEGKVTTTEANTVEIPTTESDVNVYNADMITTNTNKLGIDQIVKCDGMYVTLSCVKRASVFTTAFYSTQESLSSDNELVYCFFEVYNCSDAIQTASSNNVTCYADSNQVFSHDTNFFAAQDGVEDCYSYDIDSGASAIILSNFEVPKGWQELDIYYNDINWHITQDEADTEPFVNDNVTLTENKHDDTPDGTIIYGSGYELRYDGFTFATEQYSTSEYIVFLFHATNTSNEQLDLSLVGYNMRCYHNNIHIGTADYGFDDNVNGYTNIYDVDGIEAGMTTDIYVAFKVNSSDKPGYYSMTYDDDYITNDVKGYIYSHVD